MTYTQKPYNQIILINTILKNLFQLQLGLRKFYEQIH